jgi:polysaccharide pyruvyl transferase WcaK-like protein
MSRAGARILLLGGDADHNVGDRAIVSALSQCIVSHDPSAEVSIVASQGVGPGIRGVARMIPRGTSGIAGLCRAAVAADRILVAGGGLFQDDDSRAKMPYWAARIALLKSLNPRIAGHSIGAGPLRHVESRAAAGIACAALTTISVRDRLAQAALAACTSRPVDVVPDPAFMLEAAPRGNAIDFLRSLDLMPGRPLIVVSARRWFHSRGGFIPNVVKARTGIGVARDEQRFELLLGVLVDGLTHLARRLEAAVLLLPSYNVAHEGDDVVCEALAGRLRDVTVRVARIVNPRLYKAVLGHASLIISSRMHPLILGAGMGVPLVGLSYNDKFQGLFDQLGMAARPLPLDDFPDQWGSCALISAAEAALDGRGDLRHRAELLGAAVQSSTLEVAFADLRAPTPEVADA